MNKLWVGNPEVWSLYSIPWEFFCTLTFVRENLREPSHRAAVIRCTMFFAFYRQLARKFRIADSRILWALRDEPGETNGAMHLHALIGGLHSWAVNPATVWFCIDLWRKLQGLAPGSEEYRKSQVDVRLYDPDRDGPAYIQDELISPANGYESKKFGSVSSLMVSKSVISYYRSSAKKARSAPPSLALSYQEAPGRHHTDVQRLSHAEPFKV